MASIISKTAAAIALVCAVVLAGTGCSVLYPHAGATTFPSDTPTPKPTKTTEPKPEPSETETETASPTPTAKPKKPATVQIDDASVDTDAAVINVIAQVTNIFEDGGKCTLLVTAGKTSKSVTVKAETNVNSTQCFPMEVDLAGLKSGDATVTVTYESEKFKGTSDNWDVVIP